MSLESRLKQLKAIRADHVKNFKELKLTSDEYLYAQDLLNCIIAHNTRINEVEYLMKVTRK